MPRDKNSCSLISSLKTYTIKPTPDFINKAQEVGIDKQKIFDAYDKENLKLKLQIGKTGICIINANSKSGISNLFTNGTEIKIFNQEQGFSCTGDLFKP
jgi:pyruvate/oxaloacetate carboxyltransferase